MHRRATARGLAQRFVLERAEDHFILGGVLPARTAHGDAASSNAAWTLVRRPRPASPRKVTVVNGGLVIVKTLEETQKNAALWSTRSMLSPRICAVGHLTAIWEAFALARPAQMFKPSARPAQARPVRLTNDVLGCIWKLRIEPHGHVPWTGTRCSPRRARLREPLRLCLSCPAAIDERMPPGSFIARRRANDDGQAGCALGAGRTAPAEPGWDSPPPRSWVLGAASRAGPRSVGCSELDEFRL